MYLTLGNKKAPKFLNIKFSFDMAIKYSLKVQNNTLINVKRNEKELIKV